MVALIAPSHCFIASLRPHPPRKPSSNNANDVQQVPENDNVVIAFLGVEDLSPPRIDPKESLSIYRFTGAFRISQ